MMGHRKDSRSYDETKCGRLGLSGYMGVSKSNGTPNSSILIGFFIINHPFWGTTIFGNIHILYNNSGQIIVRDRKTRPIFSPKCSVLKGTSLAISGKSRLVKDYNLARIIYIPLDPPAGCQISAPRSVFFRFLGGAQISDSGRIQVYICFFQYSIYNYNC